jgi:hypothetical protein
MSKKALLTITLLTLFVGMLAIGSVPGAAQTTTPTSTPSGSGAPTSTVQIFVVICESTAVMNLSGTMQAGYDVYYQIFSGAGGGGTPLTTLRQVNVTGAYTFSETINYNGGTVPAGQTGSAYVAIAREGNAASTIYTTTVNDVQDGCASPQNPVGTSADSGTTTPTTGGSTVDSGGSILSPFGGVVNPGYNPPAEDEVVIGARDVVNPRQQTPGLIFAECNAYRAALPGIVYDTDNVIIFWSWFASTLEQAQAHIDNADYSVTYYQVLPLPNVIRTEIREINGLYWVFYYSVLGNLRPGRYYIQFGLTWDNAISDGFDEYGPGTANPLINTGCGFDILPNPFGERPVYNPWPYAFTG